MFPWVWRWYRTDEYHMWGGTTFVHRYQRWWGKQKWSISFWFPVALERLNAPVRK